MSCECLNYEIVCSSGVEGQNWLHDVRQLRARPEYTRETWIHTPILVKQTLEIQQKFDRLFACFKMLYSVSIPRGTADDEDIVGKVLWWTSCRENSELTTLCEFVIVKRFSWSQLWLAAPLEAFPHPPYPNKSNNNVFVCSTSGFYKNVFVQGKPFEIISTANQ